MIIAPVLFFVISVILFVKTDVNKFLKGVYCSLFSLILINFILFKAADYFTGNGINESVFYHLRFGVINSGVMSYSRIIIITIFLIIRSLMTGYIIFKTKLSKKENKNIFLISISLLIISLLSNPLTISIYSYLKPSLEVNNSEFWKYYKEPELKQVAPAKNFIYIYAESLERTYFNEDNFPGLITELREIEDSSISFTNIRNIESSRFTMGGLVTTQCGIPLIAPSHGNGFGKYDKYLPEIRCLGDILRENGYYLTYMGGSSQEYAGKGLFLESHGFNEVWGKDSLGYLNNDNDYQSSWGLYDDTVLNTAYKKFEHLSQTKDNFGLFVLTLDTHHPDGFPSAACKTIDYTHKEEPILDAVKCSDKLISDFIHKVRDSEYSDNTVIVLTSDHLSLGQSDVLNGLNRKNLFLINTPDGNIGEYNTNGSSIDVSPTIMPFIGFNADIGLGRNLLDSNLDTEELEYIYNRKEDWKEEYFKLWDFPQISEDIIIDLEKNTLNTGNRKLSGPVLLEFDEKLNTTIQFKNSSSSDALVKQLDKKQDNGGFIILDRCRNLSKIMEVNKLYGNCAAIGLNNNPTKMYTELRINKVSLYELFEIVSKR